MQAVATDHGVVFLSDEKVFGVYGEEGLRISDVDEFHPCGSEVVLRRRDELIVMR